MGGRISHPSLTVTQNTLNTAEHTWTNAPRTHTKQCRLEYSFEGGIETVYELHPKMLGWMVDHVDYSLELRHYV